MACLDMFNSEHQGLCAPMSPRISFSNDFVDAQQMIKYERSSRSEAPASSDFEFSVTNYNMMTADELFFKGRLLPFKDNCTNQLQKMTLRDELLIDDDDVPPRPPKGKWKGLLGLKRTPHILSKKAADKCDASNSMSMERVSVAVGGNKTQLLVHDEGYIISSKTSQELLSTDGGPSCRE
ncbi:PREDICTED: uncharacterized protein LOC104606011 [Nelumbo nucifera]|uniref:Uncharacterized protein LOC104606011 n=2 Tax=Nelumbo nucifera TaxID=4432 RepID=A0A1U8B180_NELNU|nr:PREDICTED: uncharacterized protein LOC104606011 [Nelumbo nucifera]DAD41241.1 TPA_asm: hypothetical protein HUJ06_015564 [Nelumbo nucifera]